MDRSKKKKQIIFFWNSSFDIEDTIWDNSFKIKNIGFLALKIASSTL